MHLDQNHWIFIFFKITPTPHAFVFSRLNAKNHMMVLNIISYISLIKSLIMGEDPKMYVHFSLVKLLGVNIWSMQLLYFVKLAIYF